MGAAPLATRGLLWVRRRFHPVGGGWKSPAAAVYERWNAEA
ncbi:hypothetical protein HMPREF0742_02611 [Rothia aeria F0184]|uniref:Uncharacterized protein n=1 Tax=Rothia aeria F0184 TaxID=888019 RepID=U7UXX2_9MICC|nr:hypothetical protein HMPREF0742_02611 [Rothia aeria F0184]